MYDSKRKNFPNTKKEYIIFGSVFFLPALFSFCFMVLPILYEGYEMQSWFTTSARLNSIIPQEIKTT